MSSTAKNSHNRSQEWNWGAANFRRSDSFAVINPKPANFGCKKVFLVILRQMAHACLWVVMSFATKNSQNRSHEWNLGAAKVRQSDSFAKIDPKTANFGPKVVYLVIFRKMSWLTLAYGLWWVLLPKTVKTDPMSEIWVRQNLGKVIVLPKLTPKRPILALKWYIWSFFRKMSWLTLSHGLWYVLLPKVAKTDPKSEIWVRQNLGKVIVLPKLA